ncbi:peptidoglycan DD-metalloendopeptidase family protein [Pseudoxanthomonas kalamensis]|uniref:peptidoglycan DD-metalloendopeptidase family protein n=1 Tax=Pseudoxanthomonas kalamensis TaxID=289483 RepID=UPI001FE99934|nr:peptidoglycan DD-metalloendopeptidase family protein [Pseudoxanthomonas kalamensis]
MMLLAALAACSSTVVRETSSGKSTAGAAKDGSTVKVKRGDTLYGIAFRNGLDFRDVARWNSIASPYTIYPGQTLRLYPSSGSRSTASSASTSKPAASATTGPKPASTPSKSAGSTATAAVSSNIRWRWPADGNIVGTYAAGDATRQGIDIAGSAGSPVRAAADGVVVYSGTGLVGYGELIIVKHNDQWLSAYGHNRKRLVAEGQTVKAGQQIAEMGRSGATRDMLHFEIRYNGKPVDPVGYLPKK